jgi:predicted Zn-dependent protease
MTALILFGIFLAVVVALLLYGFLVKGKKSEGLGLSFIKSWDKDWVPLTVVIDDSFAASERAMLSDAVKAAASFWNKETQLKLFDHVSGGEVLVRNSTPGDDSESAVAAAYLLHSRGKIASAEVRMANWDNLPSLDLARAMKHELGHCLGLAHDSNEYSVMYGQLSRRIYCVSAADKAFLHEVYG